MLLFCHDDFSSSGMVCPRRIVTHLTVSEQKRDHTKIRSDNFFVTKNLYTHFDSNLVLPQPNYYSHLAWHPCLHDSHIISLAITIIINKPNKPTA